MLRLSRTGPVSARQRRQKFFGSFQKRTACFLKAVAQSHPRRQRPVHHHRLHELRRADELRRAFVGHVVAVSGGRPVVVADAGGDVELGDRALVEVEDRVLLVEVRADGDERPPTDEQKLLAMLLRTLPQRTHKGSKSFLVLFFKKRTACFLVDGRLSRPPGSSAYHFSRPQKRLQKSLVSFDRKQDSCFRQNLARQAVRNIPPRPTSDTLGRSIAGKIRHQARTPQLQERDVVPRRAVPGGQVCQYLADHAAELVAVAAAG